MNGEKLDMLHKREKEKQIQIVKPVPIQRHMLMDKTGEVNENKCPLETNKIITGWSPGAFLVQCQVNTLLVDFMLI